MSDHIQIDVNNRKTFRKKRLLKLIYFNYFKQIKNCLFINSKYPPLEIGSSGFIKEVIPNCITSNLENTDPMIDLKENIYDLGVKKNSVSNLILIDIFHHLEFPKLALENMYKALVDGGRVIMIEPSMGLIPRIIYKLFHHEPNGFDLKINWNKIPSNIPSKKEYFAAQSIPWRAFIKKELDLEDKFVIKKMKCFSDFAYLGSGGFSYNSFYPLKLYNVIKFLDMILTKISYNFFSARMIVVLEKNK